MNKLDDRVKINQMYSKNRILFAPVVCFEWGDENGLATFDRSLHYGSRAEGGAGVIIVEATAISKEARITKDELGLWEDNQIEQFSNIAKAVHKHNSIVLIQLVHAGIKSYADKVYTSSKNVSNKEVIELSEIQIEAIIEDFVSATLRAYEAGVDGVEIHGAHTYLLNQFTSVHFNNRNDKFGGNTENRNRLPLEIIKRIRAKVPNNFIISYRFGVNDTSFKEDIVLAKQLEKYGVDLLNVSSGILDGDISIDNSFKHSNIAYMGVEIKKHVNIPVAAVNNIFEQNSAKDLVENYNIDFIASARAILADKDWGNKVIAGSQINKCYKCSGGCRYRINGKNCPWFNTNYNKLNI